MNQPDTFVHLHTHSKFSLNDGVASVEALVAAAAEMGMPALALTDHNSIAGVIAFRRACLERGIHPVYGAEIDVLPRGVKNYGGKSYRNVILAENDSGYGNLVSLLSEAWRRESDETPPHVTLDQLADRRSGLILLTGGPRTELYHHLWHGDIEATNDHIVALLEAFEKSRLVFELGDFNQSRVERINQYLSQLSDYLDVMRIGSNDVHYILPEDEFAWRFMRQAPIQGPIYPHKFLREEKTRHLASGEEMAERLPGERQALLNTSILARRCQVNLLSERRRFPVHNFERGRDADSDLWDRAFQRATQIYGGLTDKMKERLNKELDFIRREGLADYYQLLFQVAAHLKEENIASGTGQGRLLTSMVAYVLGLTEIDPLEYKLQFFGDRSAPAAPTVEISDAPVFSIALPHRSMDHVFRYLRDTYGTGHVAHVGQYISSHKGKLFSDICEWAQLPRTMVHEWIAQNILDGRARHAKRLAELLDQTATSVSVKNPKFLTYLVSRLHKRLLHLKPGEGRVIISGEELDRITPRIRIDAMDVAQIEAEDLLAYGMPQVHLESNALLNVLDETLSWIRLEHGREIDLQKIPLSDRNTFDDLGSGLTNGIPPFQSASLKTLLRRHNPRSLPQLVKVKLEVAPDDDQVTTDQFTNIFMECLLGYRCAYLKTHYKVSYMTAMLNNIIRDRKQLAILWREIRRMGIHPHLLNINNSPYDFAQANQTIRVGMKIVHLLGEKTFEEIERVRRGGDFTDLAEFCRRTDPRLITRPLIENLIRTGAFDCFGQSRAQMLLSLPAILISCRPHIQNEAEEADLFKAMGVETQFPPEEPGIVDAAEAPLQNLLHDERRITGFVITHSPLEPYREYLRRSRILAPRDLTGKYDGKQVFMAGHIDGSDRDGPALEGGSVLLMDFEGLDIHVGHAEAGEFGSAIFSELPVLVGGRVKMRGPDPTLQLNFCGTLRDLAVQDRHIQRVILDVSEENKSSLKLIAASLKRYPGKVLVEPIGFEETRLPRRLVSKMAAMKVFWCPPLYHELKQILPSEAIVLESDID